MPTIASTTPIIVDARDVAGADFDPGRPFEVFADNEYIAAFETVEDARKAHPAAISSTLRFFFAAEFSNDDAMRREAASPDLDREVTRDPDDELYIPEPSLASALDSWQQADDSIRADFIRARRHHPTETDEQHLTRVRAAEAELHALIAEHGDDTKLEEIV